jgi:fatty-acyl-CoA synthase
MAPTASFEQAATAQAIEQLHALASVLQFDDPINIQFTSGTTGSPKGATLTHHNILNNGFFIGEAMRLTEIDRLCIPVPFYHCFGMVLGNLACLTHGSCMVIPSEAFDPLAVLQTVEAEKCTGLHGVPTMFIAILGHADFKSFDLSSLRTGIMAGSPCPIEVMRKVIQDMHQSEITIAYGMTETSPVSFQSSATDPLERRVSTVGRIHPHVEVKVVDADGIIVAPGVTGELLTRGYSVMRGYWGDDANTAATIDAARWMHTGDLATIDAEGYCNIVGRIKDLVIRGGENIYPREIEEFLYTHPGIADVQVFGIPDSKYGECLCAWIKVRADSSLSEHEVLQLHVEEQHRRDEQRQHLRDHQAADHGDAERLAQFGTGAGAERDRQRAHQRASVVIRIGRNRITQAWWIASCAACPRVCTSATSIIMIAFFLTMPISIRSR